MQKLVIEGARPLNGEIPVSGSKNAALPILFATLLADGPSRLTNLPGLHDIDTTLNLLELLGMEYVRSEHQVILEPDDLVPEAPYEMVRTMRASVLCLGPLLARCGQATVAMPGGCAIGARPVDQHLKALEAMGANFDLREGNIVGKCEKLRGARHRFDMPTVGGTENALMAAALAEGESVLENCAREPEIVDLADFLISCGAKIEGHGESTIRVQGVSSLRGCTHAIMSDRIEAGTFMVAAGITGGKLLLRGCPLDKMGAVADKLAEMGLNITPRENGVLVEAADELRCVNVRTEPYPFFPTDMQAQIMALMCLARGEADVEETIFENRFMHVNELLRLGADIRVSGRFAHIKGVRQLKGAPVMASDLRASASLVLAGLAAEGTTEVLRIYHLDRGYEHIEKKLNAVGANIKRVRDE